MREAEDGPPLHLDGRLLERILVFEALGTGL